MAYDKNTDYQEKINEAVAKGDYASASKYEQQRNEKIDSENLSYDKTYNYTMPNGVDGDSYNKMKSTYSPSASLSNALGEQNNALSSVSSLANQGNIVSNWIINGLNSSFEVPDEVVEADKYLSSQLSKIQSGKTSYTDQVKEMMDKIMNREKFSYDVDADPLFQQALASAMNSGKQAMQDTIGQASALTGGYGSTYATTAGNQAYNAFIEDAYDNLPQYYQMAMEAYQMEGDEMYRQFGMLSELDDKEYSRNVTAYDATAQYRNRIYDEAYTQFRDYKSDLLSIANLKINEYGQKVNAAYNYYSAASDYADSLYEMEYNSWLDSVNQATEMANLLNNDWWENTKMEFEATENQKQRDWQSNENILQRDWESNENQVQRDWQSNENQVQRDWESNENQVERDWKTGENQKDRDFTASENEKNRSVKTSSGGGGGGGKDELKSPTEAQMGKALEAYNTDGPEGFNKYVNSIPDTYDKDAIVAYVGSYGELPYSQRTYTVIDDGGTNWGWGIDNNAKVKDEYGNEYTLKQLKKYDEDIAKELSKKEYKVGSTYTKK